MQKSPWEVGCRLVPHPPLLFSRPVCLPFEVCFKLLNSLSVLKIRIFHRESWTFGFSLKSEKIWSRVAVSEVTVRVPTSVRARARAHTHTHTAVVLLRYLFALYPEFSDPGQTTSSIVQPFHKDH